MDREERKREGSGVVSSRMEAGVPKATTDLVNGDKIEAVIVIIPESAASAGGDKEADGGTSTVLGCSGEAIVNVNRETREVSNLNNSETVLVIDSDGAASGGEDGESLVKNNGIGLRKESEKTSTKSNMSEAQASPPLINVKQKGGKGFNEDWNRERVCRICHLASNQTSEAKTGTSTTSQLIQLGCDCKNELGIAHSHCAEAWFRLKGNRMCEICGETATNVEGIGDNRFMEEWNEGRSSDSNGNTSNRVGGCWRGQPFCNFLMACLVIAFVLPWFFRINIF